MNQLSQASYLKYGLAAVLVVAGIGTGVVLYVTQNMPGPQPAHAREFRNHDNEDETPPAEPSVVNVDVVRPVKGMDYEVAPPGSVRAFQTVQLQANVSGFLKSQAVDIGDRVKRGDVLAVIAVPELDKQLQRNRASLEQAKARVKQMEARVSSAQADHEAAKASIVHPHPPHQTAGAWVRFRSKQYARMKQLLELESIDERVVDESKEKKE